MSKRTTGIHHITAIVGNPQENVDFYAGVLGLRLVKKTVNFDDPDTYHLYFGDEKGNPGTIITFFSWPDAYKGRVGSGQVGITSYVVPEGALSFWEQRLEKFNIKFKKVTRFSEEMLAFEDPHGLHLEIVARIEGNNREQSFGDITTDVAIKGFGGAVLFSGNPDKSMIFLEQVIGLVRVAEDNDFVRYRSTADIGNIIDLKKGAIPMGSMGVGTVHHIAWRANDLKDHEAWQQYVSGKECGVTPVRDRIYFKSIYFREEGGILYEIATDSPGFTHDEPLETMGSKLMLPPWLEENRTQLEKVLIPVEPRVLD